MVDVLGTVESVSNKDNQGLCLEMVAHSLYLYYQDSENLPARVSSIAKKFMDVDLTKATGIVPDI